MRVKVKAFATLKEIVGDELEVDLPPSSTVKDLINELVRNYGEDLSRRIFREDGSLARYVKVFVNGRDIDFLSKLETILKEEDEVALFPPVAGG